jgi:hypothetical protein
MKPLSSNKRLHVESNLRRWAYVPVMAVIVVGALVFRWPWMVWHDRRLRRACAAQWGKSDGRVVIAFEPGTPWHEAIKAHWIPRYGDRTSLVELSLVGSSSRSVENRVYRRWKPVTALSARSPAMIAIPPLGRGRVTSVSFAEALATPALLKRRLADVARLAFGEADAG